MDNNNEWAINTLLLGYYIQVACEEGMFAIDFSWLRDAIKERASVAKLFITPDMEENILLNVLFSKEQQKYLSYSPGLMRNFSSWISTTNSPVILIYGSSDPWYSVKLEPSQDNPAVRSYTSELMPHMALILKGFNESVQEDISENMKQALK